MRLRPREGPPALTAEQWRRVEELLAQAAELPGNARIAFIDRECAGDPVLRAELESLLASHERTGMLDDPLALFGEPTIGAGLVPGTIVAHYEIQSQLGAGGMGIVYRARDRRLERAVALKFLPAALSTNAQAKKRFLTEARAAAALQHVNVCTIHEIGEADDGRLFIAMAFIEGESLRAVIDRGPLPVAQTLEIAGQIAAALRAAHERGIIHRDVKPANVMLGADGVVKLVDFGIAKLEGSTLTGAGATPGTTAYMSPEQVRDEDVDHRTDLWALGVVLYEMLAGARPFQGETDAATLHRITTTDPAPLATRRGGVPPALERVIARALAKDRERRFQSAQEMHDALRRIEPAGGPTRVSRWRTRRALIPLAALVPIVALAGASAYKRYTTRRALASLPRIEQLVSQGQYVEAYALAVSAEDALGPDSTLQRLMPQLSDRLTIVSRPAGARVWLRRVAADGSLRPDSALVGVTPIRDLRVARADYRADIRKDGFVPVARIASSALNRAESSLGVPVGVSIDVALHDAEGIPRGMVRVPGGPYRMVGREAPTAIAVTLHAYDIDAYEVTNEQFREFVVAGGYADQRFWRHPFVLKGRTLSWTDAMRRHVDRTGLAGPREWSGQEFPRERGRHPVTGLTWYEAAAYCEFASKRLPTLFEWEKAARDGRYTHFEEVVMPWGLADPLGGIARRANFGSQGTEPVDSHPSGISPYGAYNMAGNVEEWTANPSGEERFATGGAWDDPMYVFANYLQVSAFHASASLGLRCARDVDGVTGERTDFAIPDGHATPEYRPVDDATFRTLLRHYAYDRGPLDPEVVQRLTTPDWTRETIRIAGPWPDRTVLYLYLPVRGTRPLQTIVFVAGSNTFLDAALSDETERIMGPHVKAGRAVMTVLVKGMRGRPWDAGRTAPALPSVQYRQELVLHATELRRGIDYLETRPELDLSRLAYVGFSKGAGSWLPFAAVDSRFRSVVLVGGGIDVNYVSALPEANSINFAPHVGAPTLLLNGRYDEENPWARHSLPLWRLLREPKRLTLIEGGHLPPAELRVPAINDWLDETVGPIR